MSLHLSPVAPKLLKLIPLLASNHDGEVVATVRALDRTLKSAGLDFHSLAAAVTHPVALPSASRRPAAPTRKPKAAKAHSDLLWRSMVAWCLSNGTGLRPGEADFLRNMALFLGSGREPSEKQGKWISDIHARLKAGAR